MRTILCVDDNEEELQALRFQLSDRYEVLTCSDGRDAAGLVLRYRPAAVLLDLALPGHDGFKVLDEVNNVNDAPPVLMLSAHDSPIFVVRALKAGAVDYISKPYTAAMIRFRLDRALELLSESNEGPVKKKRLENYEGAAKLDRILIGRSALMKQIRYEIAALAIEKLPVLLEGESGTGKDLAARLLHRLSLRAAGKFVVRNIGSIPDSIMESELFGSEPGAYTDARHRVGCFEEADGGSLFLDEIGSAGPKTQSALLRVVEDGLVRRLGGSQETRVDVRLITAMNHSPAFLIQRQLLREDLFYRIGSFVVKMPPLRDRPEDILDLAEHFLKAGDGQNYRIAADAAEALTSYDWPGNVRQLKACLERARVFSPSGRIEARHLRLRNESNY